MRKNRRKEMADKTTEMLREYREKNLKLLKELRKER